MSEKLTKKSVARNYAFLAVMLGSMILGAIVGWTVSYTHLTLPTKA